MFKEEEIILIEKFINEIKKIDGIEIECITDIDRFPKDFSNSKTKKIESVDIEIRSTTIKLRKKPVLKS